jgi:hypothetical protein
MRRLPAFAVMFRIRTSLAYAVKYVATLIDERETKRVSRLERSAMSQSRFRPIDLMTGARRANSSSTSRWNFSGLDVTSGSMP